MEEKDIGKVIFGSVLCLLLMVSLFSVVYIVPAGQRGVLLTWGKPSMDVVEEGLHFKIPLMQNVKKMYVQTVKIEETADSASRDLQDVQTVIALNYHLNPDQVPELYQKIGKDYESRIVTPSIHESVKSITAQFTAEELITRRSEVKARLRETLRAKLADFYMTVDDVNIVNFQFSEEFDKAIEQKVTAQQLKLKAAMDLERIEIEAEQAKRRSEAEAYGLQLQKSQITPDLVKLREIEVQKLAIEKWNGVLPMVTGGNAMPFINVDSIKSEEEEV